ncbi:hypothetical protein BCR44DRAFT_95898 [Catenaria anguillulae PL171]|uniref:Small ribosomal subunit protein mS38 n=1 Tax=Catenaria anguillulae PL171 TaxID=765915 RepID=A0A1Y2HVH1_9FUNG|nr:hypothetical protein BCR44DRAFT_95898 [Catenaria anguillulae PL171]
MFRSAPLVRSLAAAAAAANGAVTRSSAACRRIMPARFVSDSSSSSGKNGSPAKSGAAAATQPAAAAVRPSAVVVDHVKDDQLVLEGTATEIVSSPLATTAAPAAATASLSHSADLSLFLQSLSTSSSTKPTAATAAIPSHRPTGPALPLFAPDHPLMTDDFGVLPPFSSPTSLATTFGHLTISSADAEAHLAQGERQAMTRLIGHPSMPYILTPGNPMLPSGDRGRQKGADEFFGAEQDVDEFAQTEADGEPRMVTMQVMSPPGTTSPASIMGLLPEGATLVRMRADGGVQQRSEATKYWMTSVLRKRRKKMNKHKLRKLRKKTRSQRK